VTWGGDFPGVKPSPFLEKKSPKDHTGQMNERTSFEPIIYMNNKLTAKRRGLKGAHLRSAGKEQYGCFSLQNPPRQGNTID